MSEREKPRSSSAPAAAAEEKPSLDTTAPLSQDAVLAETCTFAADSSRAVNPESRSSEARYRKIRLHDQGGMGRVWVAQDTDIGREVALKEIRPEKAEDRVAVARFQREAQITGRLEHPGVAPVYDLKRGADEENLFYTMRFIEGRDLAQAVQDYHKKRSTGADASLDLSTLLHAFIVTCNTLDYAHAKDVVHRDLKPANVRLGDHGEVIVLDWGLAKVLGDEEEKVPGVKVPVSPADAKLTLDGDLLGTPAFMAPEQVEGDLDRIDPRTDIYGLGAMLYQILTGNPPFNGLGRAELFRKILDENPVLPSELCSDVPPGLEAICMRALAKKPEDRYASAKELADAVQRWQETERRQAEEALRASEEQYRSWADLIPGVVWTSDDEGLIQYANQFWFDYTGLTLEQTQGDGWRSALHPKDLPRVLELWQSGLQTGESFEAEYRLKKGDDGTYRWFLAKARPLRDREGKLAKWFGTLTEIEDQVSARQRAEHSKFVEPE